MPNRSPSSGRPDSQPDSQPDPELDALVSALLTASRALVGVAAESLAVLADQVTVTQFRTLVVLHAQGASGLGPLARRLGVNASTALRQIDRMLGAGLVDRRENPDDRRQVIISLTDAGRHLVDTVTEHRRRRVAVVVQQMPAPRRRELVEALRAFAAAAGEPMVDDAAALGWSAPP